MHRMMAVVVLVAVMLVPLVVEAAGKTLKAVMVLDKKQIKEKVDRTIDVEAIPADGFIQGTEGKDKLTILFKDIEEIVFDLSKQTHTVKTWAGKTHVLKWGLIKSSNTGTAVMFQAKKPGETKPVDESVSPTEIKKLTFLKVEKPNRPAK